MFKKVISLALSVVFSLQTCGFAQAGQLNLAGYLGQGSGVPALDRFRPAHLRYFSYEPDSDNFQILLDKADEKDLSDGQVKDKADELMKYFRIGLSLPNDKFWVNLRPDAPEQIIDPALEQTDMGKIMLEADLQLKKDTSSLTSPQTKEGKEYWDKLYKKAGELFGTENITIPTITRPWIVPGEIIVRQSGSSAYIYKAALKVMLEEDYLKSSQLSVVSSQQYNFTDPRMKELNKYSTQLIRELIIPQLTKEVNRARRYAGLRQVYYSLILARWFKDKYQGYSVGNGLEPFPTIDSGDLTNLTSKEPWSKDTYYQGYKKSFEQGEYNLSQTVHTPTGQLIRRYVSGGESFEKIGFAGSYENTVGSSIVQSVDSELLNYSVETVSSSIFLASNDDEVKRVTLYNWLLTCGVTEKRIELLTRSEKYKRYIKEKKKSLHDEIIIYMLPFEVSDISGIAAQHLEVIKTIPSKYYMTEYRNNRNAAINYKIILRGREMFNPRLLVEAELMDGNLELYFASGAFPKGYSKTLALKMRKALGISSTVKVLDRDEAMKVFDETFDSGITAEYLNAEFKTIEKRKYYDELSGTTKRQWDRKYSEHGDKYVYNKNVEIGGDKYKLELSYLNNNKYWLVELVRPIRQGSDHKTTVFSFYIGSGERKLYVIDRASPIFDSRTSFENAIVVVADILTGASSALTLEEAKERINALKEEFYKGLDDNAGEALWDQLGIRQKFDNLSKESNPNSFVKLLENSIEHFIYLKGKIEERYANVSNQYLAIGKLEESSAVWKMKGDVLNLSDKVVNELKQIFKKIAPRASSALTLDEAREGIVDIIKNNVETFIIGRIKDAKDFERLYDEIKYILEEGMITIETVMKRLVATKRTLKKGIITDELMRLGMNKTQIEFSCSNVEPEQLSYTTGGPRNEIEAMLGGNPKVIHNLGYRYNFELDYRNKDNTIHVEMVRISPKGSGIYAVNLGKHMDIIVKGQEITAEYVSQSLLNLEIKDLKDLAAAICKALGISVASSAIVTKGAASKDIGAVDFRAMDMLIQPQGSFRGLDFSPAALSGQALEAMDLDKDLEGINRMTLGRRRTHPQRLKEYISACIFKGKIDEKADDFILSMLEVFQLQSEEGIESASQDREAVVLADTRGYVLPEKRLAASNGYSLN